MDRVQNYIDLNQRLIQTMTVKSELHASLLNEEILLKYPSLEIGNDPRTWRYYLNIAGKHHALNTKFYITSFDTQEQLLFNSENLRVHRQTRKSYLPGTRNYFLLLRKYPEEELFINGSIFPVDIDQAVEANDLEILGYDKTLVEPQEISLINELQDYIYNYDVRWNVKSFSTSDSLYPAAQYAIFTLNRLQKLINLRYSKCRTIEAHSFHIREYLTSHFGLDKYMNYMTLKQVLYLYRNITYIENNIGKVDTFRELLNALIEGRKLIPMTEILVKQKHEVEGTNLPVIYAKKENITSVVVPSTVNDFTIDVFEDYIKEKALDNRWFLDNYQSIPRHQLQTSNGNSLKTKYLMTDLVDYSGMVPYSIHEALLKHWASMSNNGMYGTYIRYTNPLDDSDNYIQITDAFLYFIYVLRAYYGIDDDTIPSFLNSKRLKYTVPTVEELLSLVSIADREEYRSVAIEILNRMPRVENVITVHDFYWKANDIYEYALWSWYLVSNTHDLDGRGYVKAMTDYVFVDENVELRTEFTSFSAFLVSTGLPAYEGQTIKAVQLLTNIYLAATGFVVDKFNILKNVQLMLTEALLLLSSYSIDIVREINDSTVNLSNWAAIRIGNERASGKLTDSIQPVVDVIGVSESVVDTFIHDIGLVKVTTYKNLIKTRSDYSLIEIEFSPTVTRTNSYYDLSTQYRSITEWDLYLRDMTEEELRNIPVN